MANKKITQLISGSLNPPLSGVLPLVYSGMTFQQELSTIREVLVDSGSHDFKGDQQISGSLNVTGLIYGDGSQLTNLPNTGSSTDLPYVRLTNNPILYNPFISGSLVEFEKTDYGDEVDVIDIDLSITRGENGGIYNSVFELEYDSDEHLSPLNTEWNGEGWDNLFNLKTRIYLTFREVLNNEIGNNVINNELIMHDIVNDKYYTIKFSEWTNNNNGGGFKYIRQLVDLSYTFTKENYGDQIDIIDDGLQITRGSYGWLYNPLIDDEFGPETPSGTLWNNDGWEDLSNLTERSYVFLSTIFQGNFSSIPGNELIMKDTINNNYYRVLFTSWSQSDGAGFSYIRIKIDPEQVLEGLRFADGTIQKTAFNETSVKSTAHNSWRIEDTAGSNLVFIDQFIVSEQLNGVSTVSPYPERPWDLFTLSSENPEILASILEGNNLWIMEINGLIYDVYGYTSNELNTDYIIFYNQSNDPLPYDSGDTFTIKRGTGGEPVVWFTERRSDFRGAIIDYHAYIDDTNISGGGTIIGSIKISRDSGNNTISHTQSISGDVGIKNNADLWFRKSSERDIYFRMLNGDKGRLRIHWSAKLFFGQDYYD